MPKQNTPPAEYPQAVLQQIEQLAQNIVIARKRRKETQAQWAQRLGVSQPTMARIERGDPSVAMASYVMCLWLINQAQGLADLIAPQNDLASLEREVARTRSKPRSLAKKEEGNMETAAQGRARRAAPSLKAGAAPDSGASGSPTQVANLPSVSGQGVAKEALLGVSVLDWKAEIEKDLRDYAEEKQRRAERVLPSAAKGLAALISGIKKERP
ncbi:helix-turn-helix transcriptional regulator [Acidovorax sp. NCPPB 3576]|uniref:helix-turn-helix transcriptional regulator n=1 Tax=Acidovorax sp. NCPPB 3576 TaxID=2940488 RepID=UPI00234B2ADC|nr:helix-turn-helix transcriptional regulator [Acidovorax sp. NCPPB 3576]WCM87478.1 helix-turn-helix domain-containing protein [Acidovorax sp. NCPPB 3576]